MEGWKYYEGKKVFLILKSNREYTGKVIEVNDSSPPLIWITILDKFSKRVTFVNSEIEMIQEEGK